MAGGSPALAALTTMAVSAGSWPQAARTVSGQARRATRRFGDRSLVGQRRWHPLSSAVHSLSPVANLKKSTVETTDATPCLRQRLDRAVPMYGFVGRRTLNHSQLSTRAAPRLLLITGVQE
jgi:hypothetical protein